MSFKFCVKAKDLVAELQRSDWLPDFNEALIKEILSEINELDAGLQNLAAVGDEFEDETSVQATSYLYDLSIKRNKRCVLAYLKHRTKLITEMSFGGKGVTKRLSAKELEFKSNYDTILQQYIDTTGIDVTSNLNPPTGLMVEVIAQHDCGEILTSTGSLVLEQGSYYFISRTDAEILLKQNLVKLV